MGCIFNRGGGGKPPFVFANHARRHSCRQSLQLSWRELFAEISPTATAKFDIFFGGQTPILPDKSDGRPPPKSSPNDGMARSGGEHAPSRVVVGALADHIFASSPLPMARGEAVGGGADCHTRGRACPPELKTGALGEDLGCFLPPGGRGWLLRAPTWLNTATRSYSKLLEATRTLRFLRERAAKRASSAALRDGVCDGCDGCVPSHVTG